MIATTTAKALRSRTVLPFVLLIALPPLISACQQESEFPADAAVLTEGQSNWRTSTLEAGTSTALEITPNPFEGDVREVAEGRRLFGWMNCAGCHGPLGGGGIGPPLADRDWIYGGESMHIYQSIMQGRPNGMPAYAGKLTPASAWRIAAYVRTLSDDAPEGEGASQQGPTDQGSRSGAQK